MAAGIEEEKAPVLSKAGNRIFAKNVQSLLCSTANTK